MQNWSNKIQEELFSEWLSLRKKISRLNKEYRKGIPLIEDAQYDQMLLRLEYLSSIFGLKTPQPMDIIDNTRPKVEHSIPMLSLEHGFDVSAVMKFTNRFKDMVEFFPLIGECKIDGVAISLIYQDGNLIEIRTRGNGLVGNVIPNKKDSINVPQKLSQSLSAEIRGELFITKNNFNKLKDDFASARNAVAAMIQSIHKNFLIKPDFIPYNIIVDDNIKTFSSYKDKVEYLKCLEFNTQNIEILNTDEECINYFHHIESCKDSLDYHIDGIVLKVNDLQACQKIGYTSHGPRYAFAIKFYKTGYRTKINDIKFQVGKNGNITPVAIFDPVLIDGNNITRASMHNYMEYKIKQYGVGDIIKISRSGDAVPYIGEKIYHSNQNKELFSCPSCHSQLFQIQNSLKCIQGWDCPEQQLLRINHFCSRDALDIDTLGRENVKLLITEKVIQLPIDILTIPHRFYSGDINLSSLGMGNKSIKRILESIFKIPTKNLANIIYGLGINSIGKSHAKTIAQHFSTLDIFLHGFTQEVQIKNLGPEIKQDIESFLSNPRERWIYDLKNTIEELHICKVRFMNF